MGVTKNAWENTVYSGTEYTFQACLHYRMQRTHVETAEIKNVIIIFDYINTTYDFMQCK